ncbi:MAG: hypothetical protein GY847_21335 [Proteobacteria bacterium]|nr:hypothetical protein [Pseudomonadota bacterium]
MAAYLDSVALGMGWTYGIVLLGGMLYIAVYFQFKKSKEIDFTGVLWGMFIALVMFGPLSSVVGVIKIYASLDAVASLHRTPSMLKAIGASMNTTVLSTVLALVVTGPLCWISQKTRNWFSLQQGTV